MKNYIAALLALFVLVGGISSDGFAKGKPAAAPRIEVLDDAVMEKMVELAQPSEQHRLLSSLMGTWYYELKYWAKEGAAPQLSSGTLTNEMVLNERFLSSKTVLILNIGGQSISYEAMGILGYDTAKNAFTSVWLDTMRTGLMTGEGQYNEQKKTITERGNFTHPLMEKEQAYRSELQFIDDSAHKRTIFFTDQSGRESKVLEIDFYKQ